ncbi:inositol-1-monophosphatase [Pseudaeromonas sp. ZJS20]|uniref:inositol-1-monophosphatase n=1 Tax=Pseudaeromonas aegiceratis TaxID=3153928 RepID=UPI00390C4248
MHPMLNIAVRAARNAGQVIAKNFGDHANVQTAEKAKNDLVTNVDREAEQAIVSTLLKAYPDHSIIGEEFGVQGNADSEYQWIIDPLDGTTNFVKGIPHIAVSIALRVKGRTEVGVVFDPLRNELFTASRGNGAQLNGYRIRVGQSKSLDGTVLATSFPHRHRHYLDAYKKMFDGIFTECADIRRAGTASLDLAYVAAGRVDGYWEMCLKPWDLAAGELIAREAGALATDFVGGHNFYTSGNIVCGNPRVVKCLLAKIREDLPESLAK